MAYRTGMLVIRTTAATPNADEGALIRRKRGSPFLPRCPANRAQRIWPA